MARRKRKNKSSSLIGALFIETLAVVAFVALFVQARAERQQEMTGESPISAVAAWPSMLEETPFKDVLGLSNMNQGPSTNQNVVYSGESFLSRFTSID